MAETMSLLALRLEAPLQSWGEQAKWDMRDSAVFPSKSAVVGLIACAMGLERTDPAITELSQSIRMAVRADRRGTRMTDYHTVSGMPNIMNAEGKPRGKTIVTQRQYLQDASFLVFIDTEKTWQESIMQAFQQPKWCVYLGRKSCVPTRPVYEGIAEGYTDMMDALRHYHTERCQTKQVEYEWEQPNDSQISLTRLDAYANAASREFAHRRVWRGIVEVQNDSDKD